MYIKHTYFARQQLNCLVKNLKNTRKFFPFLIGCKYCLRLPNVYVLCLRDGGGSISAVELGQVMKTFGWTPSEIELQVGGK